VDVRTALWASEMAIHDPMPLGLPGKSMHVVLKSGRWVGNQPMALGFGIRVCGCSGRHGVHQSKKGQEDNFEIEWKKKPLNLAESAGFLDHPWDEKSPQSGIALDIAFSGTKNSFVCSCSPQSAISEPKQAVCHEAKPSHRVHRWWPIRNLCHCSRRRRAAAMRG